MQRDMEMVRRILEMVEEIPTALGTRRFTLPDAKAFASDPKEVVAYHVHLLVDAGYIVATPAAGNMDGSMSKWPEVARLTWQGHDYLDSLREQDKGSSGGNG